MEKVGERNGEEVKWITATNAIAFDQLEFFNQTLELFLPGPRLSVLSPDSGYPCCSKLYYSPVQVGQMEKILMVPARGRGTSSVSGTQDLQGCLFSTVFHPVGVQLDIEGFPAHLLLFLSSSQRVFVSNSISSSSLFLQCQRPRNTFGMARNLCCSPCPLTRWGLRELWGSHVFSSP